MDGNTVETPPREANAQFVMSRGMRFPKHPDPEGPMGAKGLGEHVLIPTAPAILNAIRDASGARINRVPALPHRVLAAIQAAKR